VNKKIVCPSYISASRMD